MDSFYQDIITDIKKGNCVLILGPDILDFHEKSFFEEMMKELMQDPLSQQLFDTTTNYVFLNEELIQLNPRAAETKVVKMMESFYKKQTGFDLPLTKLSQIPFQLIISMIPDDRMRNLFMEQGYDHEFSSYPIFAVPDNVDKPTQERPLIYNLLGDLDQGESIITFDHMFSFLSGIMGKRELPHNLQESLRRAKTFLFVGVHFERWYVQLLLRIITSTAKKEKYTILKNKGEQDVFMYVAQRLELGFLPQDPLHFIEELHQKCDEHGILKPRKTTEVKAKATIFISYSHKDKSDAFAIRDNLKADGFNVIIDEQDMIGGQKIEDFIKIINGVDIVIPVISENSLMSPWVSKEILITLAEPGKHLLPVYVDNALFDADFGDRATAFINKTLDGIMENIKLRGHVPTEDLDLERKTWIEYKTTLSFVLNELKQRFNRSLEQSAFDTNIKLIIADINKLISK